MIPRDPQQRASLRQFLQRCARPQPSDEWPASQTESVWGLRTDAAQTLRDSALATELENWEACGLIERQADARLAFVAALSDGFLPLYEAETEAPFDLLLNEGLLLGQETPAYAIAHAGHSAAQLAQTNGLLLLVPTLADVPWCAALGLVAATTGGMEALAAEQLHQLDQLSRCQTPLLEIPTPQRPVDSVGDLETGDVVNTAELDETPPGTTGEERIGLQVAELPLELVISAWSLSDARAVDPPRLRRLADRLIRAARCLGLDLGRIGVWRPSAEEEAAFAMCAEFRDVSALRRAVSASLEANTFHLETLTAADPPQDFLTARTALLEQLQQGSAGRRLQAQASEDYQRCVEQQIVTPLLQRGLEATNPIAGALQLELAQLTGLLQRQAPRLLRELTSASAEVSSAQTMPQPQRDWHQNIRIYLQLVDRLVKLAKAIPT